MQKSHAGVYCLAAIVIAAACNDSGGSSGQGGVSDGAAKDANVAIGDGSASNPGTDGSVGGPTPPLPGGDFTFGTPGTGAMWTGTPTTMGAVPVWVYPSDQTRFPRNIYRTLFQWQRGGHSEFRITISGPRSNVTVFGNGMHPDCARNAQAGCWQADEAAWNAIAGANAGQTVTVVVDGLDKSTMPPTVRRSAVITLGFSREPVSGAIFYWATTSAGIRRANVASAQPEDYLTGRPSTRYQNPADGVSCVACHVVSRDGRYMAAPVKADSGDSLWIMEVTAKAPPKPLVKQVTNTRSHGFATISPDDKHVIAAWGGKMWMVDLLTGMFQMDLPLGNVPATHPDWSPMNNQVVFATGKGDGPAGASLATMSWNGTAWGAPKTLVAAMAKPGEKTSPTNLFPMHSPQGDWIAFSRGEKGGHGDSSAQLWLVPSAGGTPVELIGANRVVSNATGDGRHQNDQPTWAPPGDLNWVAFNSKREYGVALDEGTQQIWVAAVDLSKIGQGIDPSYPAFRLQFQGLNEDNHRAYWTQDVRDQLPPPDAGVRPPTPDAGMCIATNAACDPVRDTCCGFSAGVRCDSLDNGATYTCFHRID